LQIEDWDTEKEQYMKKGKEYVSNGFAFMVTCNVLTIPIESKEAGQEEDQTTIETIGFLFKLEKIDKPIGLAAQQ